MSGSLRSAVKQYLVDQLTPRIEQLATDSQPVRVSNGWPSKGPDLNHVWTGQVTGTVTFPFIQAGNKTRDDEFTIEFWLKAEGPAESVADVEARAESYASAFEDLIARDAGLDGMGDERVIDAVLEESTIEGPTSAFTDEGAWALFTAEVRVRTRTEA
jgi:hypothetical protein